MHSLVLVVVTILLSIASCQGGKTTTDDKAGGDTISMRYATNLTLVRYDNYVEATIRNPWDTTRVLHRYLLVEGEGTPDPSTTDGEPTVIHVPVRKAGVYSSVHCSLFDELGCASSIAGVCDSKYITLPTIKRGLEEGTISDFGDGMEPNIEAIMDAMPDVLMPSPFENSGGYGRLERLGIPIVECADYMEVSPLARAEWVRFYGILTGEEQRADSLFDAVEKHYTDLRTQVLKTRTRPTLVAEMPSSGAWYIAGGKSTLGIMYHDAGADYVFADMDNAGSTSMAFEKVFERAEKADFWLVKYNQSTPLTLSQMESDNALYTHIKAFAEGRVYGCNTTSSQFYEQTPFHPDRLLANLISILHPELGVKAEKTYYSKIAIE